MDAQRRRRRRAHQRVLRLATFSVGCVQRGRSPLAQEVSECVELSSSQHCWLGVNAWCMDRGQHGGSCAWLTHMQLYQATHRPQTTAGERRRGEEEEQQPQQVRRAAAASATSSSSSCSSSTQQQQLTLGSPAGAGSRPRWCRRRRLAPTPAPRAWPRNRCGAH